MAISRGVGGRPERQWINPNRPLSIATTYASIVGVVSGLAVTLANISDMQRNGNAVDRSAQFLGGISEALVPSIIGFSLLTIAWLAVSLGMRKHI